MNCTGFALGIAILSCDAPSVTTVVVCPPEVQWTKQEQIKAAQALKELPANHPLRRMSVVTVKQRDLIRNCQAQKP